MHKDILHEQLIFICITIHLEPYQDQRPLCANHCRNAEQGSVPGPLCSPLYQKQIRLQIIQDLAVKMLLMDMKHPRRPTEKEVSLPEVGQELAFTIFSQ